MLFAAINNTKIIKESVKAPIYVDFLKTYNEIFKNKILIQDNASENFALKFNPIELMFNKCKIEF